MKYTNARHPLRTNKGGVLVLAVVVLALVILPIGLSLTQCGLLTETHSRYRNEMEAVSLLVAEELSRVVVNDPHFGFISLSNRPPIGSATVAGDGEPCPITSINNLLATIRLDTIIAHEARNDDLCTLADVDYQQAQRAANLLQSSLQSALAPSASKCSSNFYDADGNEINVYAQAQKLLQKNLQSNNGGRAVPIRNLRISLGWLKQGGTTNTQIAQPPDWERLNGGLQQDGNYKSDLDIPAFGKSFYFAATARKSALADESMFATADGKRFCSLVKVEADIQESNIFQSATGTKRWLHITACAVPPDNAQAGPAGALLVFFPCGKVDDLHNLSDLINLHMNNDSPARFYQAVGGDLPSDTEASSAPGALEPWGQQDINSHRVVAAGLYCWLRSAGVKPRIDSTLAALQEEFSRHLTTSNLVYEFDPGGNVVISSLAAMPLPISVLSDRQLFVETRGDDYSISCYNNVYNLGTINGGKHAGQPLAGDPINWCELPYFGLSQDCAHRLGKGIATGLSAVNPIAPESPIPGAVPRDGAQFNVKGKPLTESPRKSYYSGGLAVEFSVSAI